MTSESIGARTKKDWSNWFRENAERYEFDNAPAESWVEVPVLTERHAYLSERLADFYATLPAESKTRFRAGLQDCLNTLPWRGEYVPVFNLLIMLAAEIRYSGLLRGSFFEKAIFNGPLGYFDNLQRKSGRADELNQRLFDTCMLAIRAFTESGLDLQLTRLVKRMLLAPEFPKHRAYEALLLLCEARPDALLNHWKLVRPIHRALQSELGDPEHFKKMVAFGEELAARVNLDTLAKALPRLFALADFDATDFWLIDVLCADADGPIQMVFDRASPAPGGLVLKHRDGPAVAQMQPLNARQAVNVVTHPPRWAANALELAVGQPDRTKDIRRTATTLLDTLYGPDILFGVSYAKDGARKTASRHVERAA